MIHDLCELRLLVGKHIQSLAPMLCVGVYTSALCAGMGRGASDRHSHGDRGNEGNK